MLQSTDPSLCIQMVSTASNFARVLLLPLNSISSVGKTVFWIAGYGYTICPYSYMMCTFIIWFRGEMLWILSHVSWFKEKISVCYCRGCHSLVQRTWLSLPAFYKKGLHKSLSFRYIWNSKGLSLTDAGHLMHQHFNKSLRENEKSQPNQKPGM